MANDSRREGWQADSYLIIFSKSEMQSLTEAYGINLLIPGYSLVGLDSWDDFIVKNSNGDMFTIPTVPAIPKYLKPFHLKLEQIKLTPDERLVGKIKWYVKPVVFGGDPQIGDNVMWISIEKHTEVVKWWNQKYKELTEKSTNKP